MQFSFSINCWLTLIAIATVILIPAINSISATYSSALTTSSPKYARSGGTVALHYYQAIEMIPYANGSFTFRSYTPGNKDMYGYLYKDSFNPFNVTKNLIISNDDGGGNFQFLITAYLQSNNKYILIVTTFGSNVITSYSVNISGPGNNITVNLINVAILTTTTQKTEISNTATINNIQITDFKREVTTERTTTTRRIVIAGCSPPIITLVPENTSLTNPAQFRKSQDFSISSDITVNCPSSLSMIIKWTVHNCTNVCSSPIEFNESIITTSSELFIPARTLDYGLYQFKINVQMSASSALNATETVYISITQSGITANLVPLGTSIVSSGQEKDLIFDPGNYSINPDEPSFNASDWQYAYYCRSYDLFDPTNIVPLQRLDQANHQCFIHHTHNGTSVKYNSQRSSVTILSGSLTSNKTYQFIVYMINRRNSLFQATGFAIVKIEHTKPQIIAVGCVISTMCSLNLEYQFVNPTTQVALFSFCTGNCTSLKKIQWNIYEGILDKNLNIIKWFPLNLTRSFHYQDYLFGMNTSNFTATNQLFQENSAIEYWRFEVFYYFLNENSSSAINVLINQPPKQGSCSIDRTNGTTTTLFTIRCSGWIDEDGIKDYTFYAWTTDRTKRAILASSVSSRVGLRLSAGIGNDSLVNIIIEIRDTLNCVTEFDLSSISVRTDTATTNELINVLQQTNAQSINSNPVIQLLSSGNQNTIGQVLTSLSQIFNEMNLQNLETTVQNGIPASSISISPLGSTSLQSTNETSINASALNQFYRELNKQANVLDYLIDFSVDLHIKTPEHIKLQASSLAKFTESTNQLTRKTISLASSKCHQLALTLQSMASKIAYEDVKTAGTHLSQCATNVLSAINGLLQQRSKALDLDLIRANQLPDDYDTDLESEWSNPRLFADGNDFSWETIQTGRNKYYQKQQADVIAKQVSKTLASITAALNIHLNVGQNLTMNTTSVFVSLETVSFQSLANKLISQVANAQIRLPAQINSNQTSNSSVSLRSVIQPLASADKSQSGSHTNLSTSISFSILDENMNELEITAAAIDQPIELIIPRDSNVFLPTMTHQNVTSLTHFNQSFYLHSINLIRTNNLTVSFHLEFLPLNMSLGYFLIYNFDRTPQLNKSIGEMQGWRLFCPLTTTHQFFLNNEQIANTQTIIFGLREMNSSELEDYCSNQSNVSSLIFTQPFNFSSNYQIRTYTSGCYYLDSNQNWRSDGLIVGPLTSHYETQCFSSHLTTFAGGFLVLPDPIPWDYVFANADFSKNRTIYLTVICIVSIYLILLVYSRYKDKKDVEKLGVTPLPDNHHVDRYFYEIIVFTGHRLDSGTESKVQFVLGGYDNETGVRTFSDPHRKIFQRGGIDAFIMAVPKSLGPLTYLRIWHDNTGSGNSASWFVKYVIIRDLQTMVKSHFLCQCWLAVEKDDGLIERLLPIAGDHEKHELSHILSKRAYHSVSEEHLWFSIVSRPASSRFTRVQRCTCCFVLLFISMLFSILYYGQSQSSSSSQTFVFSSEQISIGILTELFALIPSLLIVQLFRRLKSRPTNQNHQSILQQTLTQIRGYDQTLVKDVHPKKKPPFQLSWWWIFIAYGLSLSFIGISMFFIIIRGIQFGDVKTQQWLTSLIIGLFSSICLTQPLKILCLSIFFGFCLKTSNSDKEIAGHVDDDDVQIELNENEEYLHSMKFDCLYVNRVRTPMNRLDKIDLNFARIERQREIQIRIVIREICSFMIFFSILCIFIYSNRNSNSFYQVQQLRHFFLNTKTYTNMQTKVEFWNWLEEDFVTRLRAQDWYNNELPRNLSGYLNDRTNRLIGWATMRQIRVQIEKCSIKQLNLTCEKSNEEEQRSFEPQWSNQTNGNYSQSIRKAFVYQTSDQLKTFPYIGKYQTYSGDGFVYEYRGRLSHLKSNLSQLKEFNWIDRQTRAVFIQMTLYNPNVQLFTSVLLLTEFLPTGGLISTHRIEPINFQDFTSLDQLIIALIYLLVVLYLTIVEVRSIFKLKMKYLFNFWSYVESGIIISSWTIFGIFLWRYNQMNSLAESFRQTNGSIYINLQLSIYVNDLLVYLFGFCSFFSTIKVLRFSRYNSRLALFGETLRKASKELFSFTIMFLIVFMAFVMLFYLLFVSKISSCSTFLQTMQMLFETILMKFDATEIYAANRFLGPISFTLFIFFVVFVGMTMFISIINHSFQKIRDDQQYRNNEDYQILNMIWQRFLYFTRIKKRTKSETYEEWDAKMRSQYYDPIERFPEKIDELLQVFDRIYKSQLPTNKNY